MMSTRTPCTVSPFRPSRSGRVAGPGRAGVTCVEILLAVSIGLLVLAGIVVILAMVGRMSRMGEAAGSLQEAALAMALLQKDLFQAVQKPDPTVDTAVVVGSDGFQMVQGRFSRDGSVAGQLVVYRVLPTGTGNFRLRRECDGKARGVPGIFRKILFHRLMAAGGPYVRVTLCVRTRDGDAGAATAGSDEVVLSSLVRIQGPEMIGSGQLSWGFLDAVKGVDFVKF